MDLLKAPKTWAFLVVFLLSVGLDQVTKWWVYTHIELSRGEIEVIPGLLSLVHSQNPGAVFGSFSSVEGRVVLFLAFTAVATGIILHLWYKLPRNAAFLAAVFGVILSGAVGNGIDRVVKQTVTDFLLVYTEVPGLKAWLIDKVGTNRWPAFNVADMALTVGVVMYVVTDLVSSWRERKKEPSPQAEPESEADLG